jgi:two-component system response regulator YesN
MYRVVIVDDEPIICKGLRDTIEWDSLGLELSGEAHNGAEALELVHVNRPHILITDIRMPGMDGIKLIKNIRELGLNTRIIILSGFSDYAFLKEAIRLGVDGYLLKPIDNDELIANLIDLVNNIEKEMLRNTQLYQGIELLRSKTLNRLVTNTIGRSEFEEKASFLDIALTADRYLCAVCFSENENSDMFGYGEPHAAFAIQNICTALAEGVGITFIDAKNRVVLLLYGGRDEEMLAAATSLLEDMFKQVPEHINKPIVTGIGIIVSTIEDIWKSYASATEHFDSDKVAVEGEQLEGKWNKAVDRTLAYIADHYHEALSLKQVANIICINTSYLGQIFKKATGESFTNYVNRYRIEKAKEFLSHSSLKVYEVAEKVGFTDYHYFLRIYKKIAGIIPTETRN